MLSHRFLRSITLNGFLFVSILIFHHLGGGSFSISPIVIPLFVLSIIYFNTRPLKEFSGPGLAATLVIFQLLGHLIFHESGTTDAERMYLSHAIAVALTYFIARYFEKIAIAVETLIAAVLPRVSFKIFILKFQQFFVCVYFQDKTLISMIFSVLRDRAPPAFSRV
jgi:hypothetical protein